MGPLQDGLESCACVERVVERLSDNGSKRGEVLAEERVEVEVEQRAVKIEQNPSKQEVPPFALGGFGESYHGKTGIGS